MVGSGLTATVKLAAVVLVQPSALRTVIVALYVVPATALGGTVNVRLPLAPNAKLVNVVMSVNKGSV